MNQYVLKPMSDNDHYVYWYKNEQKATRCQEGASVGIDERNETVGSQPGQTTDRGEWLGTGGVGA